MPETERRRQCEVHEANMIRGAVAEAKIKEIDGKTDILFEKMDNMEVALHAVQVTLAKVDAKMGMLCGKFDALEDRMDRFEERYEARIVVSNTVIDEYHAAMISINTRFQDMGQAITNGNRSVREALTDHIAEYRKFDFFRKPIIEGRDTLPKFIAKWLLIGIGGALFILALAHQADVARALRAVGILK